MKSFKEQNKEISVIMQEYMLLRNHNDNQNKLNSQYLLFAEATVLCLALERFLRILPEINAQSSDTLSNLLERALSPKKPLFKSPIFINSTIANSRIIEVVRYIRNGILHGNFEQLAIEYPNCNNIFDYFNKGHFTQDMEIISITLSSFMTQVDPITGKIK